MKYDATENAMKTDAIDKMPKDFALAVKANARAESKAKPKKKSAHCKTSKGGK